MARALMFRFVVVGLALGTATLAAQEPLVLTVSTQLEPGKVYGPIVIAADGIEVRGDGAIVRGPDGDRTGTGVALHGRRGVLLRGLSVHGFRIGIEAVDCRDLRVEDCDVADNFTAPDAGWGELPAGGGLRLLRTADAAIARVRGGGNWNGCELVDCARVAVADSVFAHCSNTGLKLWHTTDSRFEGNDFSYGLRIAPNEVHARDSTCVLIESGSHHNRFLRNDCTHGGDGIFVRVLNQWTSVDNEFVDNDASHAHNNAIEAWSPGNTWVGNKANHSSHGFWLGGSDRTVLRGNEAAWNGPPQGHANAPTPFGHCGIVFYGGSASHSVLDGNWCHDNAGPGIALVGDAAPERAAFRPFHLVVQRNRLGGNLCGIRLEQADWIDLAANVFTDNRDGGLVDAGGVTGLTQHVKAGADRAAPTARIGAVPVLRPGVPFEFSAAGSVSAAGGPLTCRWRAEDGWTASGERGEHAFAAAGSYRVGLTVDDGDLFALAAVEVLVVEPGDLATDPERWTWTDDSGRCKVAFTADRSRRLAGADAVHARIDPYDGMRVSLLWPASRAAGLDLAGSTHLVFWLAAQNGEPTGWQDGNPVVTVWQDATHRAVYRPARDLLQLPLRSESRDGWTRFSVPLTGDAMWRREGDVPTRLSWLTIGFDSWGAPPLAIWIDGLSLQ